MPLLGVPDPKCYIITGILFADLKGLWVFFSEISQNHGPCSRENFTNVYELQKFVIISASMAQIHQIYGFVSARFQPRKLLKISEHVIFVINYCKNIIAYILREQQPFKLRTFFDSPDSWAINIIKVMQNIIGDLKDNEHLKTSALR